MQTEREAIEADLGRLRRRQGFMVYLLTIMALPCVVLFNQEIHKPSLTVAVKLGVADVVILLFYLCKRWLDRRILHLEQKHKQAH